MHKSVILLLVAVSFFAALGSGSTIEAHRAQAALIKLIATPTPKPVRTPQSSAVIDRLELDRNEVLIPCNSPVFSNFPEVCGRGDKGTVSVQTTVKNPKNKPLIYRYAVSNGRIVGQGGKVVWNLNGVRSGSYTITVAIDEGRGFSETTKAQEVVLKECGGCISCRCPTLDMTGGGNIRAGETLTFVVTVSGVNVTAYNWTISQGEIVAGQGTAQIIVKTTPEMTGKITATAEIDSDEMCDNCMQTTSETATIIK